MLYNKNVAFYVPEPIFRVRWHVLWIQDVVENMVKPEYLILFLAEKIP